MGSGEDWKLAEGWAGYGQSVCEENLFESIRLLLQERVNLVLELILTLNSTFGDCLPIHDVLVKKCVESSFVNLTKARSILFRSMNQAAIDVPLVMDLPLNLLEE